MTGLSRRDGNENSGLDILDPDLLEDLDYDSLLSDDKLQSEIASFNGVDNLISASNLFADYNLEPDTFITGSADLLVNSAETVVFDDASAVNFVFAQEGHTVLSDISGEQSVFLQNSSTAELTGNTGLIEFYLHEDNQNEIVIGDTPGSLVFNIFSSTDTSSPTLQFEDNSIVINEHTKIKFPDGIDSLDGVEISMQYLSSIGEVIDIVSEETVEFFIAGLLNESLPFLIADDVPSKKFFQHRDIEVEDLLFGAEEEILFEAEEEIGFEFSTSGEELLAADGAISKITGVGSETHDEADSLSIEAEENIELVMDVLELAQGDILFEDPLQILEESNLL